MLGEIASLRRSRSPSAPFIERRPERCVDRDAHWTRTVFDFSVYRYRAAVVFPSSANYTLNVTLLSKTGGAPYLVTSRSLEVAPIMCGHAAVMGEFHATCWCPDGWFGDPSANSYQPCAECAAGRFQPERNQMECKACDSGKYCPPASTAMLRCKAAHYCPTSSLQVWCDTPGSYCPLLRTASAAVKEGRCPVGFFCPNSTMVNECEVQYYGLGAPFPPPLLCSVPRCAAAVASMHLLCCAASYLLLCSLHCLDGNRLVFLLSTVPASSDMALASSIL